MSGLWRGLLGLAVAVWAALPRAGLAQEGACRQALALGLDVSGSVDAREYRLQLEGLAAALQDGAVQARFLAMPSAPVRLMVYEWSGPEDHAVLLPWQTVTAAADLDAIAGRLRAVERRPTSPGTALGLALAAGAAHLAAQGGCWKRTLDLSGDGLSNFGPRPRSQRPGLAAQGITVNALVVGTQAPPRDDTRTADIDALAAYFEAEVILGPGAFVRRAEGYGDYARAMREKLLLELEGRVVSQLRR